MPKRLLIVLFCLSCSCGGRDVLPGDAGAEQDAATCVVCYDAGFCCDEAGACWCEVDESEVTLR